MFTGCPAGGVLSTGGTPGEIASLLDAYAKLITAFNGSAGGQDILKKVAENMAKLNPIVLGEQSEALTASTGSQLSALASLGNMDKENIVSLIDDAMNKQSAGLTSGLQTIVKKMREDYAASHDPAKQRAIWENIKNILKIKEMAPVIMSQTILTPFRATDGSLNLTPSQMAEAIADLTKANQEYQPAEIARPNENGGY